MLVALGAVAVFLALALAAWPASSKPSTTLVRIGQPIKTPSGLVVILTGYLRSNGNDASQPATGNEYIVTQWTIQNRSPGAQQVATNVYAVSAGRTRSPDLHTTLTSHSILAEQIPTAAIRTGDIVFQIGRGDPKAEVIYQEGNFKAAWQTPG